MNTLTVVLAGLAACFLAATIISILFTIISGLVQRLAGLAGTAVGMILCAAIATALGLTWTAALFLLAERIEAAGNATPWVVWLFAVVIAALPLGKAVQSAQSFARQTTLTPEQDRLRIALGIALMLQLAGMVMMFFKPGALEWWQWLPV